MDNRLEEKWDMLDEKEQNMVVTYMNNVLNQPDKSILNLDEAPARRKVSQATVVGNTARILNPDLSKEPDLDIHEMTDDHHPEKAESEHKEANPGVLGLLGFGMTTMLLNLHNAGIIEMSAVILSMGIFLGGIPQIIAGLFEYKNNNTFGATAFTSFGFFWLSLVVILLNPDWLGGAEVSSTAMGFYFLIWTVYALFLYIGTLKMIKAQQVVFASLTILFFLLAFENFTGYEVVGLLAGYDGIFCGAAAMYTALGLVLNEIYGKSVIPVD